MNGLHPRESTSLSKTVIPGLACRCPRCHKLMSLGVEFATLKTHLAQCDKEFDSCQVCVAGTGMYMENDFVSRRAARSWSADGCVITRRTTVRNERSSARNAKLV